MFKVALELIEKYDKIIIHRHSNPDCDALGSQTGLKFAILGKYPNKTVYIVGDKNARYTFIEGSEPDVISDDEYNGALAIILDTSATSLISDTRYMLAEHTLRIDHHIICEQIAQTEIVDNTFESCCGLITQMLIEGNYEIPMISAKALYTGLVTDSGRFRYGCTNARTFKLAFELLKNPFDVNEIYLMLYRDNYDMLKLRAQYILKINFVKNVAYIYTTKEEVESYNKDTFTLSRGLVNVMSDINGVDTWVNFTEDVNKGVLCEIRSSKFNINPVATKYGGGGHSGASGATLKNKEEAMALLADLVTASEG